MSGARDGNPCVHEESMSGYLDQGLGVDEHRRLGEHLDGCSRCATVLEDLRAADAALRQGLSDLDQWARPAAERIAGRFAEVLDSDRAPAVGSAVVDLLPARPGGGPSSLGLAATALAVGVAAGVLVGGFLEVRWRVSEGAPAAPALAATPGFAGTEVVDVVAAVSQSAEVSTLESADVLLGKLANLDEASDPRRWQQLRTHVLEAGLLLAIGEERRHTRDPELLSYLSRLEVLLARLINARSIAAASGELSRTARVLRDSNLLDDARMIRLRRRMSGSRGARAGPTTAPDAEGY